MKRTPKRLSIIIPVYNEETFILSTLRTVIKAPVNGLRKEIIVVDDGSTDGTVGRISYMISRLKRNSKLQIQLITLKKNQGKGAALKEGFSKSTGDIVIVQDADLEYSPHDYSIMLEPFLSNEADVVYGSRFISYRPHRVLYFWHSVANNFLTTLSNMLTNLNLTDMETGYKAFDGPIIRAIAPLLESKRFGFEPEVTARLSKIPGIRFYEVGISYRGRTYAEGKKIGWRDGLKALWEIFKYNLL